MEGESGIIELELVDRLAEVLVLVGLHRIHRREHHRLGRHVAQQRLVGRVVYMSQCIADLDVADRLHSRDDVADGAGGQLFALHASQFQQPDLFDLIVGLTVHQTNPIASAQRSVEHARQHDHSAVGVIGGVEYECLQWRLRIAGGRW